MNSLHLDPQKNHEIFQKIIDTGRISAKGHIGTHLDLLHGCSRKIGI